MPSESKSGSIPKLIEALTSRIGGSYGLWFQDQTRFVQLENGLVVLVRNEHARDWLQENYGKAVREAAAEVFGPEFGVDFIVDEPAVEGKQPGEGEAAGEAGAASQQPGVQLDLFGEPVPKPKGKRGDKAGDDISKPARTTRRWKLLSDFVVGPNDKNKTAHLSALNVLEAPGEAANPLVIHGPVGTGKTHLLEGIYAGLRKQSDQRPVYITAEEFTTRYVQAAHNKKMSAFRRQFRECTALLLDDLNFLATKPATQEEFLYTFNDLLANSRQIVVTMDRNPRVADQLRPELVDRLLGGTICALQPPDPETRLEILRKKATGSQPVIPDNVLKSLANSLQGNVRELEGAINSIRLYARGEGRPVDMNLVKEALGDFLLHVVRSITLVDVDKAVCEVLRLPHGTLQSKGRSRAVAHSRMVAMFLSRKRTNATTTEVGKYFGAKQHSTVVQADKKVKEWLDKNQVIAIGDRNWPANVLIDHIERELQK